MLLLDGFNEIAAEKRPTISEDIKYWSEFQGIQIVTSSRYDIHTYVALSYDNSAIKLQPLSNTIVEAYLNSMGVRIPTDSAVKELITIPLLLTLYVKTELILEQRETDSAEFKEAKNAGSIVWNYLQCELWHFGKENQDAKNAIIAMEFIAPYMAWQMQQNSLFILDKKEFHKFLGDAYTLLENHSNMPDDFPFQMKDVLQKADGIPSLETIRNLLESHLCLFVKNGNSYKLMHQQFRDALAAMHLINSIYLNGNSRPTEWNSTVDHYVMQFVTDLISEDEANRLWEQNRTSPQLESATRNQLELQRLRHNCDFSKLNFSDLDLSSISLFPYRYSKATIKLPTQPERMNKTKLSAKTFSPEGHEDYVLAVAVTLDGKHIVSGSKDNTIRIWDLETGKPIGKPIKGHKGHVLTIAMTPDGKRFISGSADNTIRVWDLETNEPVGTPLRGHKGPVLTVTMTPDGKHIISGSADKTIRVWDSNTGKPIGKPFEGHENMVRDISVAWNRKLIVSGSYDHTIRVWNFKTGKPIGKPINGHDGPVLAVAVTPDGKRIVSGSYDKTIRIWDLESRKPIGEPIRGHDGPLSSISLTRDGKRIVSGSYDKTIRIWNLENRKPIGEPIKGHEGPLSAISLTPDEKRFITGSYDNTIRIWDLENRNPIGKPIEGHMVRVNAVAITPDGNRIIISSVNKTVRVWDLKTNKTIGMPIEKFECPANAFALTHDGKRIAIGYVDKTIRVWSLNTGEPIGTPFEGHEGPVRAIAVTRDGKRIVSGSDDSTIRVWNMLTGEPIGDPFEGHEGPVLAIAVVDTPNGQYVVSGSNDKDICIWDMESGDLEIAINGHESGVNAVAITSTTPDEFRIVSRSYDHTIRTWDFWTGSPIEKIKEGHEGSAIAIAATLNTIRVVNVTEDNTIHVWNLKNSKPYKMPFYRLETDYVDLTQEGLHIVSGIEDKTIGTRGMAWHVKAIHLHPLSFVGLNFSKAIISTPELKETLRQNGAEVDPD